MHRRLTLIPVLLALTLVAAACGSNLSEDEILAASGVRELDDETAPAPDLGPGDSPVDDALITTTTAAASGNQTADDGTAAPGDDGGPAGPVQQGQPQDTGDTGDGGDTGGGTAAPGAPARQTCTTSEQGPIVVGSVGNYSGAGGASQANFPKAVQMWATMVNGSGGLCGREVQVIVQDDGGDPARYGALVRDLVENRGVVAFVGNGAALSHQGGIDYHKSSGVPVFGNDCGVDAWFSSPVFGTTCPRFRDNVTGMVKSGVEISGKKNFGFVFCAEAQACQEGAQMLRDFAVKDGGAKLVYSEEVSIAQVDFTAECQNAREAGAEIFTIGADAATGSRMARSCARQNYFPQYVAITLSFGPESIHDEGFEDAIVNVATFPFTAASGGAIDEYNQALATIGAGIKPDPALSIGWTGAKLFELVAARAAEADGSITPETLVKTLQTVKNETLGGLTVPLTFTPDGPDPARCYFVLRGDGTGNGFELPFGSKSRCL